MSAWGRPTNERGSGGCRPAYILVRVCIPHSDLKLTMTGISAAATIVLLYFTASVRWFRPSRILSVDINSIVFCTILCSFIALEGVMSAREQVCTSCLVCHKLLKCNKRSTKVS